MKFFSIRLFLFLFAAISIASSASAQPEDSVPALEAPLPAPPPFSGADTSIAAQVKGAYELYRDAVIRQSGEEAVFFVSSHTLAYYDEMAMLALKADSLQVDSLELIDKVTVLSFRARTPRSRLLILEGKKAFVYAIDHGMVSADDMERNELGKVFYDEKFARAPMIVNGQQTPFPLHFHLENGIWKIDLTSLFPVASAAFEKLVTDSGMPENDFLDLVMNLILEGEEPQNPIWKALE